MRWLVLLVSARPPFLLLLFKLSPSLSLLYLCFFYTYIYFKNSFLYLFQFSIFLLGTSLMVTKTIDRNRVPPSCQRCGGYTVHVADEATTVHVGDIRGWFCHCGYSAFPLIGTRARVALQRSKSVTVVPQRGPNPSPLQFLFLTLHPFGAFLRLSGLTQKQGSE